MMEMIAGLLAAAGGHIAAIVAAIAAVASAVFYHRRKVTTAEKEGRDDGAAIERDRIRTEADKATEHLEQRANEIEDDTRRDTADPDDLRRRMRDAARPGDDT